ncbi:hypothetical protein ElyMa_005454900 [Elysia marginata]|uniref:Uncharacterized protein n=1 Tax=Elysia marginata TaxID=1093978 RepID=A0AAV4EMX3_9GAST|nr:hypothetical protein ElyMa_005454900 [Elysia marginata]
MVAKATKETSEAAGTAEAARTKAMGGLTNKEATTTATEQVVVEGGAMVTAITAGTMVATATEGETSTGRWTVATSLTLLAVIAGWEGEEEVEAITIIITQGNTTRTGADSSRITVKGRGTDRTSNFTTRVKPSEAHPPSLSLSQCISVLASITSVIFDLGAPPSSVLEVIVSEPGFLSVSLHRHGSRVWLPWQREARVYGSGPARQQLSFPLWRSYAFSSPKASASCDTSGGLNPSKLR